jgi:1-deoxy-D-xylulose-5-phosphate synthase
MEDHVLMGGFGSAVLEALNLAGLNTPVERIGWPDQFVGHGSSAAELRAQNGLSPAEIEARVLGRWQTVGKVLAASRV